MPVPKDTKEPDYLVMVEHKGFKGTFDLQTNKKRVRFLKDKVRKYWGYKNPQQHQIKLFFEGKELKDASTFEKIPPLSQIHLEVIENLSSVVFSTHVNCMLFF